MDNLLAQAVTKFGLNFINKLSSSGSENVVISPLSLQMMLNMIYLGCKDGSKTDVELNKVLGYDNSNLQLATRRVYYPGRKLVIHGAMHNLNKRIQDSMKLTPEDEKRLNHESSKRGLDSSLEDSPVVFSLASIILYNEDLVKPTSIYESEVKQFYSADLDRFSPESLTALPDQANAWTKNKTNGMIEKILDKGDLDDKLVSLILNAASMKCIWMYAFQKDRTHKETFYNEGKTAASVDFMSQTRHLEFGSFTNNSCTDYDLKKLNFKALSLPFFPGSGRELSMVILLPEERNGVAKLQSGLDEVNLRKIYKSLQSREVFLKLPSFTFETSVDDVKEVLTRLGLKSISSDYADIDRMFSIIASKLGVIVDRVRHKAKITVDEAGAEADAVSYGSFMFASAHSSDPIPLIVDHPFLFIIQHNKSCLPLFIGRVNKL